MITSDPLPTPPPEASLEPAVKPWWKSRAILGGIIVIVSEGFRASGIDLGAENVSDVVLGGVTFLGGAMAIYGRVMASRVIAK